MRRSYSRTNTEKYGGDPALFDNVDIHIHVPAGAIPKDGPSAGIAMATALISAATARAVRSDVAMTGEITLRGRVLPVGGLKEKTLGALRSGVRTIVIPVKNKKDLSEIPLKIKRKVKYIPVAGMNDVLELCLEPKAAGSRKGRRKKKK